MNVLQFVVRKFKPSQKQPKPVAEVKPVQAEWAKALPAHQMIQRKRILVNQLCDLDVPESEKDRLRIEWLELTGTDFAHVTLDEQMDLTLGSVRAQRLARQLATPFAQGDRRTELMSEYRRLTGLEYSEVYGS